MCFPFFTKSSRPKVDSPPKKKIDPFCEVPKDNTYDDPRFMSSPKDDTFPKDVDPYFDSENHRRWQKAKDAKKCKT